MQIQLRWSAVSSAADRLWTVRELSHFFRKLSTRCMVPWSAAFPFSSPRGWERQGVDGKACPSRASIGLTPRNPMGIRLDNICQYYVLMTFRHVLFAVLLPPGPLDLVLGITASTERYRTRHRTGPRPAAQSQFDEVWSTSFKSAHVPCN